jgi:hypothetical protein
VDGVNKAQNYGNISPVQTKNAPYSWKEQARLDNVMYVVMYVSLPFFLFMTVFAKSFFAFVRCHFMAFPLFSTRHCAFLNKCDTNS